MKKELSNNRHKSYRPVLFILFSFLFFSANAGDLKKGFKLLNTGVYEEAIQNFYDELKDAPENVAANYGLAKVFSAKDFKRNNLDSAFLFAQRAFVKVPLKPDDKETKKYLEFGVRDFTIQELYDAIQKEAFEKDKKTNTIESFNHFIRVFKDKDLIKQATESRNAIAFEAAKKINTPESIKKFLNDYPAAIETASATLLYEELLYKTITADGKPESYKKYMEQYPKGNYFNEAKANFEQSGLEKTLKENTLDAYVKFEKSYPNHPQIGRVQDSIFVFLTREGEADLFKHFIRFHPKNRNIFQAWRDLYAAETIHDTPEEHEKFLKANPNYPFKNEVEQNLERAKIEYKVFNKDEKSGYINATDGVELIPIQFTEANEFVNGLAVVTKEECDGKCSYYYINKKGDTAFAGIFNYAGDFVDGRAVVGFGNCDEDSCKYGVIDKRGRFIIPPIYEEVDDLSEGFYAAALNEKYGYLDKKGRLAVNFQYADARGIREGKGAVKTTDGWMFVDTNGIQVMDKKFAKTSSFSGGYCAVTANDSTWGYINTEGNWAILPTYSEAGDFDKGFAVVAIRERDKKNKNIFVYQRFKIDVSGKVIEKLSAPVAAKPNRKKKK
jgi:hypothetical protein